MTQKQKEKIDTYKKQFDSNVEQFDNFGSYDVCGFGVYYSENEEDKNLTVIMTTVTGISDNYEPYISTSNIMIEPDGNSFNLTDIYNKDEVYGYIKKLKKIE